MLKLGGSLITDKRAVELVRQENLEILSIQIAEAINEDKSLKGDSLLIVHKVHKIFEFDKNVVTKLLNSYP
jgi:isopentenyl phosphate kinase